MLLLNYRGLAAIVSAKFQRDANHDDDAAALSANR
jgi:hypothetical protein